jgi:predicted ATP-grasp superfamily ATP-dependent carboligase
MPASDRSRPAVVVGLDSFTGLQTTRLLADRGVPVIAIAENRDHFCVRTRVPKRKIIAPTSGEGLVRALERLGASLSSDGPAFLLPCADNAVLTISAWRDRLEPFYRFVLPPHEVIERLIDKVSFAEHAQRHGLPIPPTAIIRTREDAVAASRALGYPAVVKPGVKTPTWLANSRTKVYAASNAQELLAIHDRISAWAPELIAQSWVEGGEDSLFSFNGYFDRAGRPQATFIARKIRQWPPDTGTSSLGVEVRDDAVLDAAVQLFTSAGYRGLAYVEMKRDERDGRYAIIEPNLGRPTGRSAIAERGGVELLLTAYCDALDLPLPDGRTQRYTGVKWIYWRHDLQASAVAMRRGRLSLGGWWRSVQGPKIEAVASLRDPRPMVAELAHVARAGWRTVRKRILAAADAPPGDAPAADAPAS